MLSLLDIYKIRFELASIHVQTSSNILQAENLTLDKYKIDVIQHKINQSIAFDRQRNAILLRSAVAELYKGATQRARMDLKNSLVQQEQQTLLCDQLHMEQVKKKPCYYARKSV